MDTGCVPVPFPHFRKLEETELFHVHLYVAKFDVQGCKVPVRELRDLIVGEPERLDLFRGQVLAADAGDFLHTKLLCGFQPRVSGDDYVVFVEQDGNLEPELLDALGYRLDRFVVDTRIVLVRNDVADWHCDNFHHFTPFCYDYSHHVLAKR